MRKIFFGLAAGCGLVFHAAGAQVARYVAWLESSGAQWIVTDFKPTATTVTDVDYEQIGEATAGVFCARGADTTASTYTLFYLKDNGLRWDYNSTELTYAKIALNTRYRLTCAPTGLWIDGTKKLSKTVQSYTPANRLMLFASYTASPASVPTATGNYGPFRLYRFTCHDGGEIKLDLVPCVDSDGKAGLHDLVSGAILYNKGTGSFLTGENLDKVPYRVLANGESGVDLTTTASAYARDALGGASQDAACCVTGAVTRTVQPGEPFDLVGYGGILRLWQSGLFAGNAVVDPIRLGGTGTFDFPDVTLALGSDWADRLMWTDEAAAILRVKSLSVTDTTGTPFTFAPAGPIRVSEMKATDACVRIGCDGGRVKAEFAKTIGCYDSDDGNKRDNRYMSFCVGGATATSESAGYADVRLAFTDDLSALGYIRFSRNVTASTSRQAEGLTNILTLACRKIDVPNIMRHGPESCIIRYADSQAYISVPGWHGELFNGVDTGWENGRFIVEGVDGATCTMNLSAECSIGTSSRVEFRGNGAVVIGVNGATNHLCRLNSDNVDWNHSGETVLKNSGYVYIAGENALPSGAGRGGMSINCNAIVTAGQTFNSLYGGGRLWSQTDSPIDLTLGVNGNDCRYDVLSGDKPLVIVLNKQNTPVVNAGWTVVKKGAGTLYLQKVPPGLVKVEAGSVTVSNALALAAGTIDLDPGAALYVRGTAAVRTDVLAAGSATDVRLVKGGTLEVGGDGADETVDLTGYTGDVSAVIRKVGSNKVTLTNYGGFRGTIRCEAGEITPDQPTALTWTGGAGANTSFEAVANWGLDEASFLRGFTATFATGGDTATLAQDTPLAGIVFDQQAAGKTSFTLAGTGTIGLGTGGVVTKLPASGTYAYTVKTPLELTDSQTWWVTNNVAGTVGAALSLCGPLSSAHDGITVTKRGWGAVNLCATGSTSSATLNLSTTGTVTVAGDNAWGGERSTLQLRAGNKVTFKGGRYAGKLETWLGSKTDTCVFAAGTTNVFLNDVKLNNGHRLQPRSGALAEFFGTFNCGGWTYGQGDGMYVSTLRFWKQCTFGSGEWKNFTFDFRAPNNSLGGDICLKYGDCRVLLNCDRAFDNIKVCQVWGSSVIDLCGHENRIGSLQMKSTGGIVTNSGEKATLWVDANSATLPEADGSSVRYPVYIRGDFKGPATLGKTGPCDIIVTNRAISSCGDITVAKGRLAFCDKSSWLNAGEVTVTNRDATAAAVLEIRQAKTLGRHTNVMLGNGGKLRLGVAGVDKAFTQRVGWFYVDGLRMPVGPYSAADGNGAPTISGTRACANLEGPGILYSVGEGTGTTLIFR